VTIGQVSKESGLNASAIRFYEQAGVLPKPSRVGGRRVYDTSVLGRLAVLERAKACGFTLDETRCLFFGFREGTSPSERWQTLARRKITELDELARQIAAMKELLESCACTCQDLAECGRRMVAKKKALTPSTTGQTKQTLPSASPGRTYAARRRNSPGTAPPRRPS